MPVVPPIHSSVALSVVQSRVLDPVCWLSSRLCTHYKPLLEYYSLLCHHLTAFLPSCLVCDTEAALTPPLTTLGYGCPGVGLCFPLHGRLCEGRAWGLSITVVSNYVQHSAE